MSNNVSSPLQSIRNTVKVVYSNEGSVGDDPDLTSSETEND